MSDLSIVADASHQPQLGILSLKQYDVVIIGAGVSCSYTVINYISLLLKQPPPRPVKLAILDKSGEFWTGIAYGQRSGQHSLIISSLKEFFPQPELDNFKHWLQQNYSWVFDTPERKAGLLASKWLDSHIPEMSSGLWEELFIPRYTVGLYLQERLDRLLQAAHQQGVVECSLLTAEAVDVQRVEDIYQIEVIANDNNPSFILTQKIVLAIGSPPNKSNQLTPKITVSDDFCYIENMYEPSQQLNITKIHQTLQKSRNPQHNQVLIIGSNASALETIYSLNNNPEILGLIRKYIVISNGGFPNRMCETAAPSAYEPQNLQSLIKSPAPTAQKILTAVKQDVAVALALNETVGSTYAIISKAIIEALHQLSTAEQQLFVTRYGVEIGKSQRRAGSDYLDVIDQLISAGKLDLLKGKFTKTLIQSDGDQSFEFIDGNSQEHRIFSTPVQVVINCAGFQDLTASSSILIKNLIKQDICIPNDSRNGFNVNENFEANKNFYLLGPLIAGNMNSKFKIWHAESCARIINLSQQLAEVLVKE
jgi:uncharacterized NAD(P)/FAD-binding protein YdhS